MSGREQAIKSQANSIKSKRSQYPQGIPNPLAKRLYTLPEAANYLGRTIWSMRELIWAGKMPIVRDREGNRPGTRSKRIFVDIVDLDAYVTSNKITSV